MNSPIFLTRLLRFSIVTYEHHHRLFAMVDIMTPDETDGSSSLDEHNIPSSSEADETDYACGDSIMQNIITEKAGSDD